MSSEQSDLKTKLERIAADDEDPDAQAWAQELLAAKPEPTGHDRLNAAIRKGATGRAARAPRRGR